METILRYFNFTEMLGSNGISQLYLEVLKIILISLVDATLFDHILTVILRAGVGGKQ